MKHGAGRIVVGVLSCLVVAQTAEAMSLARQCRRVCADEIAACVASGTPRLQCRAETLRRCRQDGIGVCFAAGESPTPYAAGPQVLSTPTALSATASSSSEIDVAWADTNDRELGYILERSVGTPTAFQVLVTLGPNQNTYSDLGLAAGTTYYYRARAWGRRGGYSGYSNIAGATTFANSTPTTASTSTSTTSSTTATTSTSTTTTRPSTSTTTSTVQTTTSSTTTTIPPDRTAPSVPGGLTVTPSSCSQLTLRWNAATDTGGSGLKGYNVYRGGAFLKQILAPATSTSDAGLSGGTVYSYAASAVDNAGNESVRSAATSTNTPACPSTGGQVIWQRDLGGSGSFMQGAWVKGMAVDPRSGNTAVTGQFQGPVNFGGGTLTSADGSVDLFVAKYSGSNVHLWSRRYGNGGGAGEAGSAVAMDSSGNVLVTGFITSYAPTDVGGGTMTASGIQDIFLAKYASGDGSPVWVKQIGGIGTDSPAAVAVDSADNIVLTGYFQNSVNFGGVTLTSAGGADVFVAKYSPTGVLQWALRAGGTSGDVPTGLAVDPTDNVLVTGSFQGSADFGGGSLTSAGSTDIFLAKYSPSGTHLWSQRFGSTSDDVGYGVAADPAGNAILVGDFMGSVDFGGGALQSAGPGDMVLAKYGPNGGHVWSKRFGSTLSGAHGQAVAADGGGNVAVTGTISSAVDFGGGALRDPQGDNPDVFVARFTSAGAYVWAKRAGVLNDDRGVAVGTDASNNVIATGTFTDSVDFGAGALTSPGGVDSFIVQLTP